MGLQLRWVTINWRSAPSQRWKTTVMLLRPALAAWIGTALLVAPMPSVGQFVAQNARAPIIQLVDPEYTVLVKIEKARLP